METFLIPIPVRNTPFGVPISIRNIPFVLGKSRNSAGFHGDALYEERLVICWVSAPIRVGNLKP